MIRLLYCSKAKHEPNQETVDAILLASRKNNKTLGITGVLIHGGGMYMQVLEGHEHAVIRTYVKILEDKRHTDSRIIYITPVKDRLFNNWTMGVIEGDPLTFEDVAELRANRMESVHSDAFTRVMRKFSTILTHT
ncbi:MAG: BLUF domain-containing protein [Limnobacter sp.]|nr:BLUF domain-containing protein [Limnobacter sp.]